MVLKLAELKWVEAVKDSLVRGLLSDPIRIKLPILNGEFSALNVSELAEWEEFPAMQKSYFLQADDEINTLKIKDRNYQVFYALGNWGYEVRVPNVHMCLGVEPKHFQSVYFAQLELSQMMEDNYFLYIVKNISKLAGNGASSRLNKGAANKAEKLMRRRILKERLGWDSIEFEKHEWLVLCKIDKNQLAKDISDEINTMILKSFLKYAFTIEEIIEEANQQKI